MPLIKLNNRSIKDVTSFPFGVGNLIHIQSQTASASSSISFTTGINSTYKEYQFYFINIHPSTDGSIFQFNVSTDGGSNYNVAKTTTYFRSIHNEADNTALVGYEANHLAQGTGYQAIMNNIGNADDESCSGSMSLFNPAGTTYVKHFISRANSYQSAEFSFDIHMAGYANTTSAINAVRFQMSSGNIDDGTIAMFGVL